MRILILGGKRFLGIALVKAIQEAGHTPVLFNRGRTNPELFPKVQNLIGDREGDLSALKRKKWDAVIDTSGFTPHTVSKTAKLLSGKCDTYIFISSISVYRDFTNLDITEEYPLAQLDNPEDEDYTDKAYGPLKALCEYEIQQNFDGKVLVIRPGLIVGPNDPTDRFTYWPWRVSLGGNILAPAPPSSNLQFIDLRDLAAFIIRLIQKQTEGVFNVTGLKKPATFGSFLVACREAAASDANFVWVDEPFLLEHHVTPWTDLPLWVPTADPGFVGFFNINIDKALKAGLSFRQISDTVGDTLTWLKSRPPVKKLKVGMDIAVETKLLREFKKLQTGYQRPSSYE